MNQNHRNTEIDELLETLPPQQASAARRAAELLGSSASELAPSTAIEGAVMAQVARRPSRRHGVAGRILRWSLAAAALLLLVVVVDMVMSRSRSGMAWADVVRAMAKIDHMQITVVENDPRRVNEALRFFRAEIFYSAPRSWRAHGPNMVEFLRDGKHQVYDIEKHEFLTGREADRGILTSELIPAAERGDLLRSVLAQGFRGQPIPEGEPVRSDAVTTAEGIDVFDYARRDGQAWSRIWVLRQSRLPIMVKAYAPQSDSETLIVFDYSVSQPAGFFDPEAFKAEVGMLSRPEQVYAVGASPLQGKATNPGQVYEIEGLKAPKVISFAGDPSGAIMIEHTNVRNSVPANWSVDDGYTTPKDNWGNRYASTGAFCPVNGSWRRFYLPVPPFKQGGGQRIVTLQYIATVRIPRKPGEMRKTEHRVLADESLKIDLSSAGKVTPQERAEYWSDKWREAIAATELAETGTALEQWQYVEPRLRQNPTMNTIEWAYKLLKNSNRREQADRLMEEQYLPMFLADPLKHYSADWHVNEYLRARFEAQGMPAIQKAADRLRHVLDEALAGKDRSRREMAKDMLQDRNGRLGWILQVESALREWERAPRPSVTRAVRDAQGNVAIEVQLPPRKIEREDAAYNVWRPELSRDAWQLLDGHYDNNAGTYAWLAKPKQPGRPLVLQFKAALVRGANGSSDYIGVPWSLPVEVAKLEQVPSAEGWWKDHINANYGKPQKSDEYSRLKREAHEAEQAKAWDKVLATYDKVLAIPETQWPEDLKNQGNLDLGWGWREGFTNRTARLLAMVHLGRTDEAMAEVASMEAKVAPVTPQTEPSWEMKTAIEQQAHLRGVRLEAVRYFMEQGNLDEAQRRLDEIARTRPSLADYSSRMVELTTKSSRQSFSPRYLLQQTWRAFDIVQWDLADRKANQRP